MRVTHGTRAPQRTGMCSTGELMAHGRPSPAAKFLGSRSRQGWLVPRATAHLGLFLPGHWSSNCCSLQTLAFNYEIVEPL